MIKLNLDPSEEIFYEGTNVVWANRNYNCIDDFVLTNKRLHCAYKKDMGLFKKPTQDLCVFNVSEIKTINGQPQVHQVKHQGHLCVQLQFIQGTEYFTFYESEKREVVRLASAINEMFEEIHRKSSLNATDNIKDEQPHPENASKAKTYVFCVECGEKLPVNARFCSACGCEVGIFDASKAAKQDDSDGKGSKAEDTAHSYSYEKPPTPEKNTEKASENQQQEDTERGTSENHTYRKAVYEGEVHKCPNCGEVLKSFVTNCPACGFELRSINTNSPIEVLAKKIEQASSLDEKNELITNFYIPNTKEDIHEFFILALSFIKIGEANTNAWMVKLEQAYQKAELSFGDTQEFERLKPMYEKALIMNRKNSRLNSVKSTSKYFKSGYTWALLIGSIAVLLIIIGNAFNTDTNILGIWLFLIAIGIALFTQMGNKKE